MAEARKDYHYEIHDNSMSISYKIDNAHRQYNLNYESVPVSSTSRRLNLSDPTRAKATATLTTDIIRSMESATGRRPTQAEAEGLAFHSIRSLEWSRAIGNGGFFLGGLYSMWRIREMKFPFRKKKPVEQYQNFPGQRMPLIRGRPAMWLWASLRILTYASLWGAGASIFVPGYTGSTMMVGLYRDPRTHQLLMDAKAKQMPETGGLPGTTPSKTTPPVIKRDDSDDQGFENAPDADYIDGQGASFEGFATPSDTTYADSSPPDANVMDDTADMAQPETTQSSWRTPRTQTSQQRKATSHTSMQYETPSPQDSSDYFLGSSSSSQSAYNDSDDASPTSTSNNATSRDPTRGGSVWGRIREAQPSGQLARRAAQAQSQGQSSPTTYSGDDSPDANSDTFSSSEPSTYSSTVPSPPSRGSSRTQNQNQSKSAAQREFDEMLERERRGVGGAGADRSRGSHGQGQQFASGYDDGSSTMAGGGGDGNGAWENRRRR